MFTEYTIVGSEVIVTNHLMFRIGMKAPLGMTK